MGASRLSSNLNQLAKAVNTGSLPVSPAHVVWSRIDAQRMRAINLPHYKVKLSDVSRQLFLDQGWDMPRGLQDRRLRDPLNFTREEWQQAKRVGLEPYAVSCTTTT